MTGTTKNRGIITHATGDIFTFSPRKLTLNAWKPLHDCIHILFVFQQTELGEDRPEWRFFWISGLAILRSIGHVLAKADTTTTPHHRTIIDGWWEELNNNKDDNPIFWNFIEKERNSILKVYQFGAECKMIDGEYAIIFEGVDGLELFREAVYWWRDQLTDLEGRL